MKKLNPKIGISLAILAILILGNTLSYTEEPSAQEGEKGLVTEIDNSNTEEGLKEADREGVSLKESQASKLPEYAPGHLIVKLKEGKALDGLKELNAKYQVISSEKAFQEMPDPKDTLTELKDKFAKLGTEHESWYWQLDKDSQEYKDYITKLEKEKEELQKQIQAQEKLIAHLEQRQKRAPEDIEPPNLENTYLLKTNPDTDIPQMAADYSRHPAVEYAQPNYRNEIYMLPNDPYYSSSNSWGQGYDDLWGLKKIQADKAWDISQGEGVTVAVIDTGVDYGHEDIVGNVWINPLEIPANGLDDDKNGYIDDTKGYDFSDSHNNPADYNGHGTHVAGTIAATGNNSKGIIGVAPKAKVMAVKIFPNAYDDVCAKAIKYAADNGADVLSNSWGPSGPRPSNPIVEAAVSYAYAKGCIVVFAAGNKNMDVKYYSPANSPYVIAVAASDQNDNKCWFSNYGLKIDVSAPGGGGVDNYNILSLLSSRRSSGLEQYIVGSSYLRLGGTSMACPHVSGLAALILSRKVPTFTNEEVRQVIRISADDIATFGFDTSTGYGRINAYQALKIDSLCIAKITSPQSLTMFNTGTIEIKGSASGGYFQSYILEYASIEKPQSDAILSSWTQIGPEVYSPVYNGLLGNWQINSPGYYYLRLTVKDKTNYKFQDTIGPVFIGTGLHKNWPKGPREEIASWVIGDVDKDGKEEIVVGTYAGKLHIFKDDGRELIGWPLEVGSINSDICLADIDKDGDLEIFFASSYSQDVFGYHHTGLPINGWPSRISDEYADNPSSKLAIGDVDGDGALEIIVFPLGSSPSDGYHTDAYIFKKDGFLLAKWELNNQHRWLAIDFGTGFSRGVGRSPAIADINEDGKEEIIVAMQDDMDNYYLDIFDYQGNILKTLRLDGITVVRYFQFWIDRQITSPVIGDLDKDGDLEIVVLVGGATTLLDNYFPGKLFIWSFDNGNYTNTVARDIKGGFSSQLSLADLDTNGDLEIVCAATRELVVSWLPANSYVRAFHHDGTLLWKTDEMPMGYFAASPVIGDVDGDGRKEVIVNNTQNSAKLYSDKDFLNLYIYNHDGSKNSEYTIPNLPSLWQDSPSSAIGDFDNNGKPELLIVNPTPGDLFVWDMQGEHNRGLLDWSQPRHDYQRTGVFIIDKTPPVTTDSGIDGLWHKESVTVTLAVTDSGSGVDETYFFLDGITPSILYNGPITVTNEGTSTLKYYSIDKSGNAEAIKTASNQIKIDKTPPVTTGSGTDGNWHESVTVTLTATDTGSGVDDITYNLIDDKTSSAHLYEGPFTVSKDGVYTLKYYSRDKIGNPEEMKTEANQIKIDKSAPSIPIITSVIKSTEEITVYWSAQDKQSGIVDYSYRVIEGSKEGRVIRDWESVGNANAIKVSAKYLNLTKGKTYYFAVKARNGAGLWSDIGYSDAVTLDPSAFSNISMLVYGNYYGCYFKLDQKAKVTAQIWSADGKVLVSEFAKDVQKFQGYNSIGFSFGNTLKEGKYMLKLSAVDSTGKESAISKAFSLKYFSWKYNPRLRWLYVSY